MCHQKAKGRMKVRNLVAKLQSREYNWMFGVDYQSTDESEWEEVISEGSGDEQPGQTTRIKSQNPWQSHLPRYHAAHICAICVRDGLQGRHILRTFGLLSGPGAVCPSRYPSHRGPDSSTH
ncbi:hypothetical protein JB92DRAFT_1056996 [Gautieria morchelliformis]|nr:hypothetical protein JB92DRAFT_1056996 [Gautieria morchelliformis]